MMNWPNLLSDKRPDEFQKGTVKRDREHRNDFERDHDRVVFSSAFRSLQDKTQVVPLPEHDFVHTRLTHSLETSCVGRSLGKITGQHIIRSHPELKEFDIDHSDIGAIVASACLAHDIGNPPFGHSGEKAISAFFRDGEGQDFRQSIANPSQWEDLCNFEGNANGFRILTRPNSYSDGTPGLTSATLGAFTKYPTSSTTLGKNDGHVARKKYGFFRSEKEIFSEIAEELGLTPFEDNEGWYRHPLAYLVEAADDICYSIIDLEDGLRAGLISGPQGEELLREVIGDDLDENKLKSLVHKEQRWAYLRAKAINSLVEDLSSQFIQNEESILKGELDRSLLKTSEKAGAVKAVKDLSFEKVYRSKTVLEIEAAGFEVLGGLLGLFTKAVHDQAQGKNAAHSQKILDLTPNGLVRDDLSLYEQILDICSFISGMSDSYALSLYRKLKGIELPKG